MKKLFITFACMLLLSACQPAAEPEVRALETHNELPAAKPITCRDLKTQDYQAECEERLNTVAGQILADEVLKTYDLDRCDQLSYDKMEYCKTYISETGIKGPIPLDQGEVLAKALQPIYPLFTAEEYSAMAEEERDAIEPEYKKESCANLDIQSGLRAYCEGQIQEKIEFNQLKQSLLSQIQPDCATFTRPKVVEECENVK